MKSFYDALITIVCAVLTALLVLVPRGCASDMAPRDRSCVRLCERDIGIVHHATWLGDDPVLKIRRCECVLKAGPVRVQHFPFQK
jgi:hypothetical protein